MDSTDEMEDMIDIWMGMMMNIGILEYPIRIISYRDI
jgi:hypothetical protein